MSKDNTEITITHYFKSKDIVAESDLLLQYKIRELLRTTTDVSDEIKVRILDNEARDLKMSGLKQFAEQQLIDERL